MTGIYRAPSRIGRFLEISIQTDNILNSIAFYRDLGFREVAVGEVWDHPYAVMSDGRLFIGLHEYNLTSPAITYVLPELAGQLNALRELGLALEYFRTQPDEFNEAGFLDPDELMVSVLEARTFSPPNFDEQESFSHCGHFEELSIPVRNIDQSISFWEPLGFVALTNNDQAFLTGDDLNLGLYSNKSVGHPMLSFRLPLLEKFIPLAASKGISFTSVSEENEGDLTEIVFRSPDDTLIRIRVDDSGKNQV